MMPPLTIPIAVIDCHCRKLDAGVHQLKNFWAREHNTRRRTCPQKPLIGQGLALTLEVPAPAFRSQRLEVELQMIHM